MSKSRESEQLAECEGLRDTLRWEAAGIYISQFGNNDGW